MSAVKVLLIDPPQVNLTAMPGHAALYARLQVRPEAYNRGQAVPCR